MAESVDFTLPDDRDYGGLIHGAPLRVERPVGAEAIAATVRACVAGQRSVGVRGSGHSVGGQSLAPGGVLIRPAPGPDPVRWLDADRVDLDAAATLESIEGILRGEGRTLPVLPDYLGLTLGGVLSAGGYGPRSVCGGALVDHVEALTIVLATGAVRAVGPQHVLFRFALAGLGHMGVIARATLRTAPVARFAHFFVYPHDDLPSLATGIDAVLAAPHQPTFLNAAWRDGSITLHAGYAVDGLDVFTPRAPARPDGALPGATHLESGFALSFHETAVQWKARHRGRRHLWGDVAVDRAGLGRLLTLLQGDLERGALRGDLAVIYLLVVRGPSAALPFEATARTGEDPWFLVGLYYEVDADDRVGLGAARQHRAELLEAALAAGGRPYLYGWHELSHAALDALYGDDLELWARLRADLDPDHRFRADSVLTGALRAPR